MRRRNLNQRERHAIFVVIRFLLFLVNLFNFQPVLAMFFPMIDVGFGYRRQQALCVNVHWIVVNVISGSNLNNAPASHNGNIFAHMADNPEIMRNKQVRNAKLALDFLHEVKHLGLNG